MDNLVYVALFLLCSFLGLEYYDYKKKHAGEKKETKVKHRRK